MLALAFVRVVRKRFADISVGCNIAWAQLVIIKPLISVSLRMKFYVDTSAWGGYYDKEFSEWTIPFIEQARQGKFIIVLSDITLEELQGAPEKVRDLATTISPDFIETVTITDEQLMLAGHYIKQGALTQKYYSDAQHIAIASILKVDSLVSWNFRHMVNFFRIKQYNSINLKFGYQTIDIRTPKEVTYGDEE